MRFQRDGWHVRTVTETRLSGDSVAFHINAKLRAWENETLVREFEWDTSLPRAAL